MFSEFSEIFEFFRNSCPLGLIVIVPIIIIVSPMNASQEFKVYRMHQFDLQGSSYGSKHYLVNMEARSIHSQTTTHRCLMGRIQDVSVTMIRELASSGAGALLILLPEDMTTLSPDEEMHIKQLEQSLFLEELAMPIYFASETQVLRQIYDSVVVRSDTYNAGISTLDALVRSVTSDGFQMMVSGPAARPLPDFQFTNLQGHLPGYGVEEQSPTIAIAAHYDAIAVAPGLSCGADSNASGVVALLELARLFSKLYSNSRMHGKYNLVFLLLGAGKFNYQGAKRWIEENVESSESVLMANTAFVLCLDSLASGQSLHLHVSKPPKDDTEGDIFLKNLALAAGRHQPLPVNFSMLHKKINLADDMLAWEHERFSMKRLPAFTLSHFTTTTQPLHRGSILDTRDRVSEEILLANIHVIAEALAHQIYNLSADDNISIFPMLSDILLGHQSAMLRLLSSHSRAAQLLPPASSLLTTLERTMEHYLRDVRCSTFTADSRDPDFMLYDGAVYTMNVFSVKPAVFDLFFAGVIAIYLLAVYLLANNFHYMCSRMRGTAMKVKAH